jgi:hypothetical protein
MEMTKPERSNLYWNSGSSRILCRIVGLATVVLLTFVSNTAQAQGDIRYSWFEIAFVGQDVDRMGSRTDPILMQSVDIDASDGNGIMFRGSVGTWHNLYAFIEFSASDIDVAAVVTNPGGMFPGEDEFDFTSIRGGIGLRFPLRIGTDIYGELSYDSLDLDFGSFAGENFDTDGTDIGASIGIRHLWTDKFEMRVHARYTNVGDADLSAPIDDAFDSDTLFGVGFGYELVRGLSITGDYEVGEFTNWNFGFRLDLDES